MGEKAGGAVEDFSAKIADLLQNEEAMGQLTALLSSLQGGGEENQYQEPAQPQNQYQYQEPAQPQNQYQDQGTPRNQSQTQQQSPVPQPDLGMLLGALGGQGQGGGFDLNAILGMLGGGGRQETPKPGPGPAAGAGDGLDPRMLGLLGQAMGSMKGSDQNIQLLQALRPYLEERRQGKVDDAIRVLRLLKLVPLIQESGIFPAGLG